jgi:hypothetical protein
MQLILILCIQEKVFDDVKTFARLRLTCRSICRLVDAADVRFTIVKHAYSRIIVDVRGVKYERIWRDGEKEQVGTYKMVGAVCHCYYDNGSLRSTCTYKNGKKEGIHASYCRDNSLRSICTYKNGKKEGAQTYYWGVN